MGFLICQICRGLIMLCFIFFEFGECNVGHEFSCGFSGFFCGGGLTILRSFLSFVVKKFEGGLDYSLPTFVFGRAGGRY